MKHLPFRISILFLIPLLFIIHGCEGQGCKVDVETETKAIQVLTEAWCTAFEAGDTEAVLALYSDDIVRIHPDVPISRGKKPLRDALNGAFELFTAEVTWPIEGTEEIVVTDGWAFHLSEFVETFTPKAHGERIIMHGTIIEICQKQPDGSWKFAREIWNRNNPVDIM